MTFGYDANIHKSRSTLHMVDNAENLLFEILQSRNSEKVHQPIKTSLLCLTIASASVSSNRVHWP